MSLTQQFLFKIIYNKQYFKEKIFCLFNIRMQKNKAIPLDRFFRSDAIKAIKYYFKDVYAENKSEFTIDDLKKIEVLKIKQYRGFGNVATSILIKLINEESLVYNL
ncbi:hypothetical protein GENT5_01310 [Flavobacterium ammoniigenes]|uniref:Uncharacterized protein n=1 Tax=Flavobacterium ammoniigenes TaxID=1751095 RepID=A0ABN6KX66_9FLAO|nr:hypothetical protein [Flavobacterium ammoniigenes]BDB53826.1 hypothetical protein GENT5_01310 [Flavobacterium ammoniigenes]